MAKLAIGVIINLLIGPQCDTSYWLPELQIILFRRIMWSVWDRKMYFRLHQLPSIRIKYSRPTIARFHNNRVGKINVQNALACLYLWWCARDWLNKLWQVHQSGVTPMFASSRSVNLVLLWISCVQNILWMETAQMSACSAAVIDLNFVEYY